MLNKDQILLEQAYMRMYEEIEKFVIDANLSPAKNPENFRPLRQIEAGQSGIGGDSQQMAANYFNNQVTEADHELSEIKEYGIPDDGENAGYSKLDGGGYEIRLRKGQEIMRHLALSLDNGITVKAWNDPSMNAESWAKSLRLKGFGMKAPMKAPMNNKGIN